MKLAGPTKRSPLASIKLQAAVRRPLCAGMFPPCARSRPQEVCANKLPICRRYSAFNTTCTTLRCATPPPPPSLMLHEPLRAPKHRSTVRTNCMGSYDVVLRGGADPPGCSTIARGRLSRTGLSAPRISQCYLEHIVRHRAALRGVALHGAARRCVARERSLSNDASTPPNLARQIAEIEL